MQNFLPLKQYFKTLGQLGTVVQACNSIHWEGADLKDCGSTPAVGEKRKKVSKTHLREQALCVEQAQAYDTTY